MTSLRQRAVSSVGWNALSQGGRQGLQLITAVILARLLSPSDFGVMSMALVVTGFVAIFRDLGTSASIIQRREISEELLSGIFWVNVGFGALVSMLLFLLAPLLAMFYQEENLAGVLRVLSISFLVAGAGVLHQTLLEREMSFRTLSTIELVSVSSGAIVGIISALANAGVWSLVFQSLIMVIVSSGLLWRFNRWRPQRMFRTSELRSVSGFSLNLAGFNVVNYFARNADYVLIGRFLGAQELGYYTLAYRILLFPIQNISDVVGRVMFPALATLQEDKSRFISIYLKVIRTIALIAFPLMFTIFALAEPIVLTFLGSGWQPAIALVMIFTPIGLIQSVGSSVGLIYQAQGRTDAMFRWGLVAGLLYVSAFGIGIQWGTAGVAACYAVMALMLAYPNFLIPFSLIGLRFGIAVRSLVPPLIVGLTMMVLMLLIRASLASWSNGAILVISVVSGAVVFLLASWTLQRDLIQELWGMIRQRNLTA